MRLTVIIFVDIERKMCVTPCLLPLSKQQQEQDPTNLYISNLPLSMDEQELENMLKPFGHVISTRILRDANGLSRGVGFARYRNEETLKQEQKSRQSTHKWLSKIMKNVSSVTPMGQWYMYPTILMSLTNDSVDCKAMAHIAGKQKESERNIKNKSIHWLQPLSCGDVSISNT